jgi:DNA repair exonuclease SbcCD nuclease subunit
MRIAVLSDLHFGYAYTSALEDDSFDNAEDAMEKALDSDLIIIAGDIFDSRLPRTSVWARAIKVLVKPLLRESSGVTLVSCTKELRDISKRTLNHIPVIAIHGTHERRGKGDTNAIEALENAGILIHLHQESIVFEKGGEKVAIYGLSGVPERFAKDVLDHWNPQPLKGCTNILVLHQSIEPYIYSPNDPPTISLSNLPKGFDFIVDGHIHMSGQEKIGETKLLIPGSTIMTQMEKNEAAGSKGFFMIDTEKKGVTFREVSSRRFFYDEIKLGSDGRAAIEKEIQSILSGKFDKPPVIKLKLSGKQDSILGKELKEIESKYSDRTLVFFSEDLESDEVAKKIEFLRDLRKENISIEEIGLKILKRKLEDLGFASAFDYDDAFKLLNDGETDKLLKILLGEQSTLGRFGK